MNELLEKAASMTVEEGAAVLARVAAHARMHGPLVKQAVDPELLKTLAIGAGGGAAGMGLLGLARRKRPKSILRDALGGAMVGAAGGAAYHMLPHIGEAVNKPVATGEEQLKTWNDKYPLTRAAQRAFSIGVPAGAPAMGPAGELAGGLGVDRMVGDLFRGSDEAPAAGNAGAPATNLLDRAYGEASRVGQAVGGNVVMGGRALGWAARNGYSRPVTAGNIGYEAYRGLHNSSTRPLSEAYHGFDELVRSGKLPATEAAGLQQLLSETGSTSNLRNLNPWYGRRELNTFGRANPAFLDARAAGKAFLKYNPMRGVGMHGPRVWGGKGVAARILLPLLSGY